MTRINDWKKTPANTINIDWTMVEKKLGFKLHENLKDFYSRVLNKNIDGIIQFDPERFVKEYINKENWLVNTNGDFKRVEFTLFSLKKADNEYVSDFFENLFFGEWTGGNDFGHRAYIGELIMNIGQIAIIFNNDTGKFEWVDFGYGYFEVYEENPYGIVADTAQEFLDKF